MTAHINKNYLINCGILAAKLTENSIPFEVQCITDVEGFMFVFPNQKERTGDVILHNGSYGHSAGLFEGYQAMYTVEDDVCVFDSIDDVVEMAKRVYKKG